MKDTLFHLPNECEYFSLVRFPIKFPPFDILILNYFMSVDHYFDP